VNQTRIEKQIAQIQRELEDAFKQETIEEQQRISAAQTELSMRAARESEHLASLEQNENFRRNCDARLRNKTPNPDANANPDPNPNPNPNPRLSNIMKTLDVHPEDEHVSSRRRQELLDKTCKLRDVAISQQCLRTELEHERACRMEAEAAARAAAEREARIGVAFEQAQAHQTELERIAAAQRDARRAAEIQRQHAIDGVRESEAARVKAINDAGTH